MIIDVASRSTIAINDEEQWRAAFVCPKVWAVLTFAGRSREDQKAKARAGLNTEVNLTWRVGTVVAFE
jgi:hypothetical protein